MNEEKIEEETCQTCENNKDCKDHKHDKKGQLKKENEDLKKQIEELKEKVKYAQADLINYRKRKDEETANMLKYANQDLILELIPILDNFERAIKLDDNNLTDELSKFLQGFKMMYARMVEVLKSFGIEEIDAYEKPFDPNIHEALMIDNDPTREDNIILEVLLKGYKLKDRIIRASAVRVNKIEKEEIPCESLDEKEKENE